MKDFLEFLEKKLKNSLSIQQINIIDNTDKHKSHKHFQANKYHLKLEIKSNYLDSLSKVEAQRYIMKILKEELKNKIHALEIKFL